MQSNVKNPLVTICKKLFQTSYSMYFNSKAFELFEYHEVVIDFSKLIITYADIDSKRTYNIGKTRTICFGRRNLDHSELIGTYELIKEDEYFTLYKISNEA